MSYYVIYIYIYIAEDIYIYKYIYIYIFIYTCIRRGAARTVWPRTTSVPAGDTADVIFEQIYLIIDNDIKIYFFISV